MTATPPLIKPPEDLRDESAERQRLITWAARFHVEGGAMLPCCQKFENLTREHQVPQRKGLTVRVCRRCGRRHFVLRCEPGSLLRSG